MAKEKKMGLNSEEISAMKEYLKEKNEVQPDGEAAVLAKIAGMPEPDRSLSKRLHALIRAAAPGLAPRTWYGMPAYAKDGKVVCYFQPASKFKARYLTVGFSDKAKLDEGNMWPVTYAVMKLSAEEESEIAALVKKAVG